MKREGDLQAKLSEHLPVGKRVKVAGANSPEGWMPCELCGTRRPDGPNSEMICCPCGMKDKQGTEKKMGVALFGGDV